jgi:hypothetical protein
VYENVFKKALENGQRGGKFIGNVHWQQVQCIEYGDRLDWWKNIPLQLPSFSFILSTFIPCALVNSSIFLN